MALAGTIQRRLSTLALSGQSRAQRKRKAKTRFRICDLRLHKQGGKREIQVALEAVEQGHACINLPCPTTHPALHAWQHMQPYNARVEAEQAHPCLLRIGQIGLLVKHLVNLRLVDDRAGLGLGLGYLSWA